MAQTALPAVRSEESKRAGGTAERGESMGASVTTRDDQTGLMDLGAFTFVVDHVVKRAARSGECATVLSITLEADSPGERAGQAARSASSAPATSSAAIYYAVRMLRTELRAEDVVARIGDREFGVALPETDADQGEIVAAWITEMLDAGPIAGTSVTVGRTTFDPTGGAVSCEMLLSAARASCTGPSHVTGAGETPLAPRRAPEAPADRIRLAGRRHLRPLRSAES